MAVESSISPEVVIAHGPTYAGHSLLAALSGLEVTLSSIACPEDLPTAELALVLLDAPLLASASCAQWRERLIAANPESLLMAEAGVCTDADVVLSAGLPVDDCVKIIHVALRRWLLHRENSQLRLALAKTEQDLELLADIGIALSAEKDLDRLLDRILREAQNLACCDAASLFLVEKVEGQPANLAFKLTRNYSIDMDFEERRMALDRSSIVGYAAVTGEELNIPDAYQIPPTESYSFNADIDRSMGYYTVSILALPIRNYREEVIGVLQFINRKSRHDIKLDTPEAARRETLPFDAEQIKILHALASQSAVAIENSVLLENINRLFGGFVQAAVGAIEQRDPTTSGHSFRVADLTTELAIKLPLANLSRFRGVEFREDEIKELRYAALLHDFGKVGVREHVLMKAHKLPDKQFELIRYRIRLAQERLRSEAGANMLQLWQQNPDPAQFAEIQAKVDAELERLEKFLAAIDHSNKPTVLDQGDFEHLLEVREYPFNGQDEGLSSLITEDEFSRLSIRRGSLSAEEREAIESHVVHTASFLRLIPWTPELGRIPELAEAHHEKLDGTGYPLGLHADDIPVGSKMMAICDIYDALTASDRPYKSAVPSEIAYDILQQEAGAGKLDVELVGVFIDANINEVLVGKDYGKRDTGEAAGASHHPCEPELED